MEGTLELAKEQLSVPLGDARRKLLIILNIAYVILVPVFLYSEKISTGSFVPDPVLYIVYVPAFTLNLISAIYNVSFFFKSIYKKDGYFSAMNTGVFKMNQEQTDNLFGWLSIVPILTMSFCNMIGLGNPSSDAILTDFALAHNLIIGVVMIIGRQSAIAWFFIVVAVLLWHVSQRGWDYEYHYLTPTEVAKYQKGLAKQEGWALDRAGELKDARLNPPKITRYFNTWIVFIIISFMGAYFFSGITIDIIKIIPKVIKNIESAIEGSKKLDLDLQNKQKELEHQQKEITKSAMRIVRYNEILEDLNSQIENLDYKDKKNLIGIIGSIRKALDRETDWENFETKFDSVHSDFFKIIQQKYPHLTQSELKHLAYIRMNLSSTEIAKLMEVKKESLRTLRHRLKKKMNICEDIDLRDFTLNIELFE